MRKFIILLATLFSSSYIYAQQIQWAQRVSAFSSEKDIDKNSIKQVVGEPNAYPIHDDQYTAWEPKSFRGIDYIKVAYASPQNIQQILVVESYMPGSIAEIYLYDEKDKEYKVYENKSARQFDGGKYANVFRHILPAITTYKVSAVKLVLYPTLGMPFPQIDAIGISSEKVPITPKVNTIQALANLPSPVNLGPNINTPFADMIPIVSPDGNALYFARKKAPENMGPKDADDIYVSKKSNNIWAPSYNIGPPLNNENYNFVFDVSPDGNTLYLANRFDYKVEVNEVAIAQKTATGWSTPELLQIPNMYNLNNFDCYSTSIDGKILMMAVERKDCYGDMDIYVSFNQNGKWSEPFNIGFDVNSAGTEASVFLCADGKTIYFASNGFTGYGDFDIYMSKRLDNTWKKWSKPLNMGPVINTPGRDIYFSVPASGDMAYFSSDFYPGYGLTDIYKIPLPLDARPTPVDIQKPLLAQVLPPPAIKADLPPPTSTKAEIPTNKAPINTKTENKNNPLPNSPSTIEPQTSTKPYINPPANVGTAYDDKIEALKKQIEQAKTLPPPIVTNTPPPPQPLAVKPTTAPITDPQLEKDIDALKNRYESLQNELAKVEKEMNNPTTTYLPAPTTKPYQETTASDPYQDKLAELKKQMEQSKNNAPKQPTYAETKAKNPEPQKTNTPATADPKALAEYQAKLNQQNTDPNIYHTPENNGVKLPPNPNVYNSPQPKPYQPVEAPDYDEFQKKLDELKASRDNKSFVSNAPKAKDIKVDNTNPEIKYQPTANTTPAPKTEVATTPVNTKSNKKTQPTTQSYEEKLKQLKGELEEAQSPANTSGIKLDPIAPSTQIETSSNIPEKNTTYTPIVKEEAIPLEKNAEVVTKPNIDEKAILAAQQNIESSKQEQEQLAKQKDLLNKDVEKLSSQKETLEQEKEKLLAQQNQMLSQKDALENERKKLNEILAQMQAEKDKLDAEKKKLEYDKQRLEQEKYNQAKDIKDLQKDLDSLSKLQVKAKTEIQKQLASNDNEEWAKTPVEVGSVIVLKNIYFIANASYLQQKSNDEMNKLVAYLNKNKNIKVEIGGHTNGLCDDPFCVDLSTRRAKEVMDFLISNGISANRLTYKGYGKSQNIADNVSEEGRKLNQRVEMKVLEIAK